jgi:arylformamidase
MAAREMDREFALDDVADLPALFARRKAAAEAALAAWPVRRGAAYGPGPAHRLNLFPADRTGGAPAPVMMFIHGGFWKSLDADLFSFLAPGFVPAGAALAVIDYPLMPAARMDDIVAACAGAAAWLAAKAGRLGIDADRMVVAGNSAGGHLVAELLACPTGQVFRAGTAISGIYDLEPVTRSFQNDDLGLTPDEVARFSPLCRTLDLCAPVLVAVGERETGEFRRQSAAFARKVGAELMTVPGTDHITILLDALAVPGTPLNTAVLRQMGL